MIGRHTRSTRTDTLFPYTTLVRSNAADAIATAKGLMRRGASFDAGLMQINSANFARLGLTPETVFDPCTNLRAGAHVLTDNYRRASDAGRADPLRAALRSEEHTSELQYLMRNSYAVFCLKKKKLIITKCKNKL